MYIKNIWILALILLAISIYSYFRKTPMTFWTGQRLASYKIKNIKLYNSLNSLMWFSAFVYFSVAAYFEFTGDIDRVVLMANIFTKYILLLMVAYYIAIYYWLRKKQ